MTVGQKIADSDRPVSAPIHASVSGTVSKMTKIQLPGGQMVDAVVIDSDGEMTPSVRLLPRLKCNSLEELLAAVQRIWIGRLGWRRFSGCCQAEGSRRVKKLIPLLSTVRNANRLLRQTYREAMENSWDVLSGVYALWEMLGVDRVLIAVENNKPEAIRILTDIAESDTRDPEDHVRVLTLKSRYPQGAEKVLVQACTGRKIRRAGCRQTLAAL